MTLLIQCWNLISFSGIIISAQFWPAVPGVNWLIFSAIFFVFSSCFRPFRWFKGGLLAFVVVVFFATQYQTRAETAFQDGLNITITGRVDSLFKEISHGRIVTFSVDEINGRKINYFSRPNIKLSVPFDYSFLIGERWRLSVRLKPVYGKLNEAGFDQEKYYVSQNLHAKGALTGDAERIDESDSLRLSLHSHITELTGNFVTRPLLLALTFGDRNHIQSQIWEQLKASGLIHLVAISGLHIGMAFMIGWIMGTPLSLFSARIRFFPLLSGLLLATCYAWLAGFSLPTKRALMMCVFVFGMPRMGLNFSRWQILLFTFCLILLSDPFATFSVSFWMSFGAVAAIYLLLSHPAFSRLSKLKQLLMMQLILVTMMTPITAYFFSGVSLASPIYNLIFVPWFSFIVIPLIFIALFFSMLVSGIAPLGWKYADLSLQPVLYSIRYAGAGWVEFSSVMTTVIAVIVILWVVSPLLNRFQQILLFCTGLLWSGFGQKEESWQLDILDVGHGLAVLIGKESEYILYDTGYNWGGGSIAESIIAPVLVKRGVNQLEGLIISHTDSDHVGGKIFIENRFSPMHKWSSENLPGYQPCIQGESWHWKGLSFKVLWPPERVSRAFNPHSCVIRISDGDVSILLTGDIDAVSEYLLARQENALRTDILLVPHHGSDTSSTSAFIDRVNPKVAIASLGKGNHWGIPTEKVLNQYKSRGIMWMDTGESGQISIRVSSDGWQIRSARGSHSPPWYRQILRKGVE